MIKIRKFGWVWTPVAPENMQKDIKSLRAVFSQPRLLVYMPILNTPPLHLDYFIPINNWLVLSPDLLNIRWSTFSSINRLICVYFSPAFTSAHKCACETTRKWMYLLFWCFWLRQRPTYQFNCLHVNRCTSSKTLPDQCYASIPIYFRDLPVYPTTAPHIIIQIYPEINLPLYHDAFLLANHEDLAVH